MDYSAGANPFLLFLSLTLSLLFILRLSKRRKPSPNLPPGPTPFPIIGSLLELGDLPHRSLARLAKAHGPILSLQLGLTTTIVISSPQAARLVLQTHDPTLSARLAPHALTALGHSHVSVIWMPPSPQWKHLRTILKTHLFTPQRLDAGQSLRKRKVEEMVEHVRGRVGKTVDVGRAALCTMINEISNLFFLVDLVDVKTDSVKEFEELIWGLMEAAGRPNISDFFPALGFVDLQGRKRRVKGHLKKLYELFDNMIERRLENFSGLEEDDFLNALLRLHVEEKDNKLDLPTVKAILVDNFVAGSETSSNVIEWTMAELLRHPSIIAKARAELMSVVGPERQVEESDIPQLPFLQAIVKENLRLHPPGPFLLPHKAETNVVLDGYTVPKGSRVMVNVWAIGRDESTWEDAESFVPERFMESQVDYRGRHFELIPFGSGRRICPGLLLAYQMVHLMLASLIHSFEWRLPEGMNPSDVDLTEKFGITLALVVPLPAIPFPVN